MQEKKNFPDTLAVPRSKKEFNQFIQKGREGPWYKQIESILGYKRASQLMWQLESANEDPLFDDNRTFARTVNRYIGSGDYPELHSYTQPDSAFSVFNWKDPEK
jgi:hypothetical protein